jgi:hypothetical protein
VCEERHHHDFSASLNEAPTKEQPRDTTLGQARVQQGLLNPAHAGRLNQLLSGRPQVRVPAGEPFSALETTFFESQWSRPHLSRGRRRCRPSGHSTRHVDE